MLLFSKYFSRLLTLLTSIGVHLKLKLMANIFKNLFSLKPLIKVQSIVCQSNRFAKTGKSFPQFINLPPHYPINGTGSTYQTKIVRKRQIIDPNIPDFKDLGRLRWSDWRMLRDVRRRYIFARYHPMREFLYAIRKSKILPTNIKVNKRLIISTVDHILTVFMFRRRLWRRHFDCQEILIFNI